MSLLLIKERIMKLKDILSITTLTFLMLQLCGCSGSKLPRQIVFQESMQDFPNPERGFYRARELTFPENFDLRGENITLIYGRISADDFRDKPFSAPTILRSGNFSLTFSAAKKTVWPPFSKKSLPTK